MISQIKKAIDTAQRAQRNYDLTKFIPDQDLEALIYAAIHSPSKQNETHYALHVYTDRKIIREIYNCTKYFSLSKVDQEGLFKEENGKFWQDTNRSVHNSQILANVVFVYTEDHGKPRGKNSMFAVNNPDANSESNRTYQEQINYSIGASFGQLIMSAALLGYKTGLCSAFPKRDVQQVINSKNLPKLLVGVGYENVGMDRRLHAETLNRDVPEIARTGELNEHWQFPSFEKHIKVTLNGTDFTRS